MKVRQVLEQGKQDLSSYSYLSDFKLYPNANAGDYMQRVYQGKESGAREFREKKSGVLSMLIFTSYYYCLSTYIIIHAYLSLSLSET